MAIDQSAINAIQAYYLDHSAQRLNEVLDVPLLQTNKILMDDVKDKRILQTQTTTTMLQPYQTDWTPKGDVKPGGRLLETHLGKIDLEEAARTFATDNYLLALKQARTNDPYAFFPYEQWVVDGLMARYYNDLAVNLMWTGEKAAVVAQTAGNAADICDGYLKLIRDDITATNITPYATGVMDDTNAVTKVEDFVDNFLSTPALANTPHFIHCSQADIIKYRRSYRALHGQNTHASPFGLTQVEGYNVFLVPEAGIPENALVMTRAGNLFVGMDGPPSLIIEKHLRKLYFIFDVKVGFNYASAADIFVNDQIPTFI